MNIHLQTISSFFFGRYRIFKIILLLVVCFPGNSSYTQTFLPFTLKPAEPSYLNITTKEGLPSSETYDIHQDRNGYIWIATDRGVVRYDGYRYKLFTKQEGLPDNVIFNIYEDYKGRVWFVGYNTFLSYYENGKMVKYRYNNRIEQIKGALIITFRTFYVDKEDNVYYAMSSLGGYKISAKGKVTSLNRGRGEAFVIKTGGHWLPVIDPGGRTGIPSPVRLFSGGKSKLVNSIHISKRTGITEYGNRAFVQMQDFIYDANTFEEHYKSPGIIGMDLLENELFIGRFRKGVRREVFSRDGKRVIGVSELLADYSVSSVMKDSEGGYWFTTLEAGVFYTPSLHVKSFTEKQGLLTYGCSLAGNGKDVYLAHFEGCTKLTAPYTRTSFFFNNIPSIQSFRDKILLGAGTARFKKTNDPAVTMVSYFFDYYERGDHLTASMSRICKIFPNERFDTIYSYFGVESMKFKRQNYFHTVVETPSGRVFAGNQNGIFEIRDQLAHSSHLKDSLFKERAIDMEYHAQLGSVVGTRGKGIYCFNDENTITLVLDEKNGLLSNQVNCLYVDKHGLLYAGTNRGLSIFSFEKGKVKKRWNLTTSQGLCSNEINSVYRQKNELWVATTHGVSIVDMTVLSPANRGTVHFAFLELDGKLTEKIPREAVSPYISTITIGFRTDNFRGMGKHRFRYRLRDDAAWQTSVNPEIRLNEPRSGDYVISVQFLDDSEQWSETKKLLHFTIDKPFYAEWYFIALLFLLTIGIFLWIFKVILRRVKARHHYQTTINQLKQKALSAQMNPHFIFNSMNSIQSFLMYEENEKAERYLLKFSSLIRKTLANSRENYIALEEELTILQNYLELEQMRFRDKFRFTITIHLKPEQLNYYLPPMLIQPYIENAVLHGVSGMDKDGIIMVTFSAPEEKQLKVIIDDNGVGRLKSGLKNNSKHRSFGTAITEERLTVFRDQLGSAFKVEISDKIEDGISAGTRIELTIPLITEYEGEY